MNCLDIVQNQTTTRFIQVVNPIVMEIEKGNFKKDDQLPSITSFSKQYKCVSFSDLE